eukprot:UN01308
MMQTLDFHSSTTLLSMNSRSKGAPPTKKFEAPVKEKKTLSAEEKDKKNLNVLNVKKRKKKHVKHNLHVLKSAQQKKNSCINKSYKRLHNKLHNKNLFKNKWMMLNVQNMNAIINKLKKKKNLNVKQKHNVLQQHQLQILLFKINFF